MMRGGRGDSGFTLLELLVALVVLGLLMVGLTEGVRAGLALRQAQVHRLDESAGLDAAMRLLRNLLTRIPVAPQSRRVIASEDGGLFQGDADTVSFVGDLPTGLGTTRRADLTLLVRDGRLFLSWTPHRHEHSLAPPPAASETELLRGVARLELSYWGSPTRGVAPGWQTHWEAPDAPELIRLRIVFVKGDKRRWPDLIAAPRP